MPPITNARVLFASVPKDFPVPGETTVHDTAQQIDLASVALHGGFLVKTLVLSIDPYMRGKMRAPGTTSYSPPYTLGAPLTGYGVGVVLRSEHADVAPGRYVYGAEMSHQEYVVLPGMRGLTFLEKDAQLPWTVFVGAAGMPGRTAYMGWMEFAHAKKGETAFVTAGAGPVGSLVIQMAKHDGLKVIASAGSDEKVAFLTALGADVAFNYKTTDTRAVLAREGPVDIYWDNVGGEVLEAALDNAAVYARFLECGMISGYNTGHQGIKNLYQTYAKSLTLSGILVLRLQATHEAAFWATVPRLLREGKLQYREEVSTGLAAVGDAILRVQRGMNTGKAVVVVAEE
ncbi:alcohol dehydrogenase [Mycena belliarum]|uniref:Alcohol dehydrogenase n=1 Tax=Mycena belliarum TaxID=1033014 RepID=A0AAD6XL45_9AGAR|nr:alcohol dehydrogenase [Mycena belliae]